MSETQCSKCGTPITGKGKTGMCRKCALAAAREARLTHRGASEDMAIPEPLSVQEQLAPTHIREKTIFEEVDVRRVGVAHDRPLGDGPKNDPTVVYGKDPKKVYRWVDENPDHVKRAASRGLRPVKAKGSGLEAPLMDHGRVDGYHGHRGIALMEGDRAQAEARKAANKPPEPKELARAEMEANIESAASKDLITPAQADKFRGQFQEHEETVRIAKEDE